MMRRSDFPAFGVNGNHNCLPELISGKHTLAGHVWATPAATLGILWFPSMCKVLRLTSRMSPNLFIGKTHNLAGALLLTPVE